MGWDNPLLTAPISVGDLSSALNVASLDIGTIIRNSSTINKWAKFKAVKHSNPGILSAMERATVNYGISIPFVGYSTINAMVANLLSSDWTYDRPTAGQPNEWFRLLDFDGYNNAAPPPIYPIQSITDLTSAESTMSAGLGFGRNISSQSGYLTLDDLHINGHSVSDSFGEYYFGICLYYSDSVRYATTMADKYKTIQASLSEIGLSVRNVSVPGSGSRIYRAIPFFASIPFDTMPSNYQGSMYPIPFAECQLRITKMQDPYIGVIMYTLMGETDKLYYQYKIINPTATARTYNVNVWALSSYNINDTYGSAVRTDNSVSVSANSSYTLPLQTITDGIRVRDILANAPFVGAEMRVGEARVGYSISSIIIDADPSDPPTL